MNDESNLGPCCDCGGTEGVVNILMLNRRGPIPGCGWGCVVCDLPCDGAVAVLCNDCCAAAVSPEPRLVCVGYPKAGKRMSYADLSPEPFDHDLAKHREQENPGF